VLQRFKAIGAMSLNRVIGRGNKIPWRISEDLRWFKKMTSGHAVVMGRKTFDSIGGALPGRATFVLSRSHRELPGVKVVSSLTDIDLEGIAREIFICGGGEVYAQTLPLCSDLYLTLVKREVEGDVFFPPFEELFVPEKIILDRPDFRITHYRNCLG
jgi:dihydrofolate reductase